MDDDIKLPPLPPTGRYRASLQSHSLAPPSIPPADAPPVVAAPKGTSREIHLKSGGTLTLAATLDLFALSSEDRTFVFDLIDKLEGYAKANQDSQK